MSNEELNENITHFKWLKKLFQINFINFIMKQENKKKLNMTT